MSPPGAGATAELARWAAKLTIDDLPDDVRTLTADLIADTLGCAVGGHLVPKGSIMVGLVASYGGAAQASVPGSTLRAPIPMACLASGELMNALDSDAVVAPGHVTPYVVAPALAFAESAGASGEDLVVAVAVAHEIGCRVAAALDGLRAAADTGLPHDPLSPVSGYGSTILGAAAGAGWVLGFDATEMANVFGIAGYAAPVPAVSKFLTTPGENHPKYTSSGQVAMNAALAVDLTRRGYRGDSAVLDGDYGFWRMFASSRCDWDYLLGGLGSQWRMRGAQFKPFPSYRMSHDALYALRAILDEHPIDPASITRISTTADPLGSLPSALNTEINDHAQGQQSLPYLLAAACFYDDPIRWQTDSLSDSRVRDLVGRVEITRLTTEKPKAEGGGAPVWLKSSVEVEAAGTVHSAAAPAVTKGHPDNALTADELRAKYLANTTPLLGAEHAARSWDLLRDLPTVTVPQLCAALTPTEPKERGT